MQTVVWLDRESAKIFDWINGVPMHRKIDFAPNPHHHSRPMEDEENRSRKFFRDLAHALQESSRILIVGPGLAKHHFRNHLVEHHPMLLKRVVGCETVDHPTDHQITAFGGDFFEALNTSENPARLST